MFVLLKTIIIFSQFPYLGVVGKEEKPAVKRASLKNIASILKTVIDHDEVKHSPFYKDDVLKIPVNEDDTNELLEHWAEQAFSGLIAALATKRLKLVEPYDQERYEKCASKSDDIQSHAKCFVELEFDTLKNRWLKRRRYFKKEEIQKRMRRKKEEEEEDQWIGSFLINSRKKREVKTRSSYELKSQNEKSRLGLIGKHLGNIVRIVKNKETIPKWQNVVERIKEEAFQLKQRKRARQFMSKRMKVFKDAPELRSDQKPKKRMKQLPGDLRKFEEFIQDDELREMFHDAASNMTDDERIAMIPVNIVREATKIGLKMAGVNSTDLDNKSLKLISPRFFSVVPEDEENTKNELDLLSPSLFALHDASGGEGVERNTSLSSLIGHAMSKSDSQQFIDVLIELTGVTEAVENAEEKVLRSMRQRDDVRGPDGQPLFFTKQNITKMYPDEVGKIELFEKLDKMFTAEQMRDMNRTGYTIMTKEQRNLFYGPKSEFRNPRLLSKVDNMTRAQINKEILQSIKDIGDEKIKFEVRKKDIVLTPLVLQSVINAPSVASQPLILSPAVLTPVIQSPAIYGVVVLSPWLFVPLILSPRILSPVILDPFLFVPIVLSPLALDPVVLSPGVFNPVILSPLLMDPFIPSPQVMTPIILSPFCMTPLIVTPLALSPLILSPFVLSPQVLSPQFVTAFILSPSALSPPVGSPGVLTTAVLSPSLL
ncbi:unnamed protein product [Caenorhabditis bovis]|uniref:Uncharacterized protein n=1 Tax=Caenorhabditis bovis TaxID=2654633 RepID=A0A8S1EXL1_9PELO|nr:unnamed protein product [Caenorhabditis bovis]